MVRNRERTKHGRARERNLSAPASVWREKDSVNGRIVDAGVIILRTRGCSHFREGGCSMCGYNIESSTEVNAQDLRQQFANAMESIGDVNLLKVYTSGSFLDENEIPADVARMIAETCTETNTRLLVESRPEYVISDTVDRLLASHDDLEVAIGLESANDSVLKYSINKGFGVADYDRAAGLLRGKGIAVRTYILLKPPFLTEAEAMDDAIASARHASELSEVLSINPVNVQKGTLVERLWKTWSFRPPWLWSVLDVVTECTSLGVTVVCNPVGGGSARGAHNCGKCDGAAIEALRNFSHSQDPGTLTTPACQCRDLWNTVVDTEPLVVGGTSDLRRFFQPS